MIRYRLLVVGNRSSVIFVVYVYVFIFYILVPVIASNRSGWFSSEYRVNKPTQRLLGWNGIFSPVPNCTPGVQFIMTFPFYDLVGR